MHIIQIHTYRQLLTNVRSGNKHAIIQFTSPGCPASNNLKARLAKRRDVNIDVFDIEYYKNKPIGALFDVKYLPCAILVEHGMPVARANGLFEMDNFLEAVDDVVFHDKNPFE
jgi:thioredoxin-like negative regulator of GroEL